MSGTRVLTTAELKAADEEHALAHRSLRSDFETLLLQVVDKAGAGEDVSVQTQALLEAYNSSSETNVRLMSAVRHLRNSQLKDTVR